MSDKEARRRPDLTWVTVRGWELHAVRVAIAIALFVAGAYGAVKQPVRTDPFASGSLVDWVRNPLEINVYKRWPVVAGSLNDLFVAPDGQRAWAVGSGGLILRTEDGGASWRLAETKTGPVDFLRTGKLLSSNDLDADAQARAAAMAELERRDAVLSDLNSTIDQILSSSKLDRSALGDLTKVNPDELQGMAEKYGLDPKSAANLRTLAIELQKVTEERAAAKANLDALPPQQSAASEVSPEASAAELAKPHLKRTLRALVFLPGANADFMEGWAVGNRGVIHHTTDGGATWQLQTLGLQGDDLYDIAFMPGGKRGFVVGATGLYVTEDGGQKWRLSASAQRTQSGVFRSVAAGPEGSEFVVATTEIGEAIYSINAGRDWLILPTQLVSSLADLSRLLGDVGARAIGVFKNPSLSVDFILSGFAASGASGADLRFDRDFGRGQRSGEGTETGRLQLLAANFAPVRPTSSWIMQAQASQPKPRIYLVMGEVSGMWRDPRSGTLWFVGSGGQVWRAAVAASAGAAAGSTSPPTYAMAASKIGDAGDLRAIGFGDDGERGWAAATDGSIFRTEDGGTTWRQQTIDGAAFLGKMNGPVTSENQANALWSITPDGKVMTRRTSGEKFLADDAAYRQFPAPWTYLAWLVGAGFVAGGVRRAPEGSARKPSIADQGVSDRPLEPGDQDPLKFGAIATAISMFIRNEKTLPPLTIAVMGAWGSGKSSILNLVKHDLEKARFQPLWFNAWHHENEDNLLASLLESIRTRGVPPIWQPAGWIYRAKLFWIRLRRRPVPLLVLLFLLALSIGILQKAMPRTHVTGEGIVSALRTTADAIGQTIDWLFSKGGADDSAAPNYLVGGVTLLTLIGAALDIILKMRSRLGAQGIDPLRLFAGGRLKASDLQERAGFRQKFAAEFHDVTKALNPTTMVIIIDDLDRCRKENVMSTLQLINFLVSSGDCYILIGIAREQIIAAIRDQFPDDTAEQYLDKLVNIEIPVPTLGDEERLELLKRALAEKQAEAARRDVWRDRLRAYLPRLATIALFLAVLAGGVWLGDWMAPPLTPEDTGQPPPTAPQANAPESPAEADGTASDSSMPLPEQAADASAGAATPEKEEYQFVPGGSQLRSKWPIYVLGILLLLGAGMLYELLRRRQVTVVHDSEDFGVALGIWNPVIGLFCDTPRAIKRFMNRLRYIAMRERSDQGSGDSQGGDRIPEPILVALSTLDRVESGILKDAGRLAALGDGPETAPETALWAKPVKQAILDQKEEAAKSPPEDGNGEPVWPPTPAHIKRYRQLIASVTAR